MQAEITTRAQGQCELCKGSKGPSIYHISPPKAGAQGAALVCQTCLDQLQQKESMNAAHWHALGESIWSEVTAVKVIAWRVLDYFSAESWATQLLEQLYLDEEELAWAQAAPLERDDEGPSDDRKSIDSNGAVLSDGDSVTLIKDLEVKGAGFTAKRGTLVKNISLTNNPLHIEGKINGTQIVLVTKFLKKS